MSSLVGEGATLWNSYPEVALALWVSIPSGDARIGILRSALCGLLELRPPPFTANSIVKILPLSHFSPPLPIGNAYVGVGSDLFGLKPSVWLNPFLFVGCGESPLYSYRRFAVMRPDVCSWLAPLAKASVLVCDCLGDVCVCHACVLLDLLKQFGETVDPE